MDLIELKQIEEALRSDKMTYLEARGKIYRSTTKPWQTEEWKKRSNERIKDFCEQCGSRKGPMVLQQTWHPSPYKKHEKTVYESFLKEQKSDAFFPEVKDEEVQLYLDQFNEMKGACLFCGSSNIGKRKMMKPSYRCRRCDHEFDEPKMVPYNRKLGVAPSFAEVKRGMIDRQWQGDIWDKYGEEIKKRAVLKGIEEHKRYMSLEGTKTFCKPCAFLWDNKKKKVCGVCKEALIPIKMNACYSCQKAAE